MAQRAPRSRKTIDDLPDDVRGELIGGEVYASPPPTNAHQRAALAVAMRLESWATPTGAGRTYAPAGWLLASGDFLAPDVAFDWLVEVADRAVEVLRLVGNRYEPVAHATPGDVLRSPVLPEFELPVAAIFAP